MAIKPVFQKTNQGKTSQQYLDELDALLKKNTGRFTNIGTETSSQSPMFAGNVGQGTKMADPTGVSGFSPMQDQEVNFPTTPEVDQNASSSIDSFLSDFNSSIQIYNATPKPIATSQDGGTIYSNGYIKYEDGSYRLGDPNAYPIASSADGGIVYSDQSIKRTPQPIASMQDGSVKYDDGTIVNPNGVPLSENDYQGIQAISQGLFGGQQAITQPYGNVNPVEITPGNVNLGTDFRTRDLVSKDIFFPVGAEVVQILRDDGTRYGDISGHQGYGNSIMLRLPSGEMLRLSHLSRIGELQEGQVIQPNTLVGATGATGNVTGEHLDVEYYNSEGQIDNPANFTGFTKPETFVEPQLASKEPTSSQMSAPQAQAAPVQTPKVDTNAFSQIVNAVKPTGSYGLGLTELSQGDVLGANTEQNKLLEGVSTSIGAPELNTTELSQEQNTNPFRQAVGNLVDVGARKLGINTDLGLSEMLAGGKTTNTDESLVPQAMASDKPLNYTPAQNYTPDYTKVFSQNLNDAKKYGSEEIKLFADRASAKAGEGIQSLKNIGAGIQGGIDNIFDRVKPQNVSGQRMIGENTPGSNALPLESTAPGGVVNDVRDAFFKQGGAEMYKDYMNPGQEGDGALSLGLFNDKFYQDPNNIANVFGATNLVGQATDKYKNYQRSQYQGKDEYGNDLYDQGEVNNYINSITPFTTPQATFMPEVRKQNASFMPKGMPSMSAPKQLNYSVAKPAIQQISRPVSSGPNQNYTPSNANTSNSNGSSSYNGPAPRAAVSSGPQQNYTPVKQQNYTPAKQVYTPPKVSAPVGKIASGPNQNYSPAKPAQQSQPKQSIFSRAVSAVKSIFRR